jgi:Protein of unknown function (DUF3175)
MAQARPKRKWSAEFTAHSDALDLENRVFAKTSANEIARSLKRSGRSQRPPQVDALPLGDVDADPLRQSRWAKPVAKRQQTLMRAKSRLRALFGRTTEASARLDPGRPRSMSRYREPTNKGAKSLPHETGRENNQPYATENEDYSGGVAHPPMEQVGRREERKAPRAKRSRE